MKILGIGVDIVYNKRIKSLIKNKNFINRTFAKNEIKLSINNPNKVNFFAKRFAAKEALAKSFGTGFRDNLNLRNIEVLNDTIITSDKAIYFKNNEKVITSGNSKAINDNNTITASSLEYDKINNIFKAKRNAVAQDFEKNTTIYADEITYLKNKEKLSHLSSEKNDEIVKDLSKQVISLGGEPTLDQSDPKILIKN